ncbi:MAG: LacI family transcriptional regulator, partial [Thermoanaerobacteraceae bacterium]|nr:LacI family transcriptional regulator [Thermoanaerobacteraceae bacterium]
AFFAANDLTALGVIKALKTLNLSVPRDVSVVGYDNTILAELTDPPLTTINQQMRKMGYLATKLLIQRIKAERSPGKRLVCDTQLVLRKTTAAINT